MAYQFYTITQNTDAAGYYLHINPEGEDAVRFAEMCSYDEADAQCFVSTAKEYRLLVEEAEYLDGRACTEARRNEAELKERCLVVQDGKLVGYYVPYAKQRGAGIKDPEVSVDALLLLGQENVVMYRYTAQTEEGLLARETRYSLVKTKS